MNAVLDFAYRIYASMTPAARSDLLKELILIRVRHALQAYGPFPEGTTVTEAINALPDGALDFPEPSPDDLPLCVAHLAWVIGEAHTGLVPVDLWSRTIH